MTSRSILASSVFALSMFATLACGGIAVAQPSTAPTAAEKAGAAATRAADDVKNWTNKQWQSAKREWAKDKQKWSSCQARSHRQKLSGRKSWSFLYSCMTG